MIFKLEHHQKILIILNSLRADFFAEISAFFGGGTLLSLLYGEYRWSKGIDFICPIGNGYRNLRSAIHYKEYDAIFKDCSMMNFPREIKADQYGVRFVVKVEGLLIKFEVVAESRISLQPPVFHSWTDVPCLSFTDSCAEKLLANSDRWADRGVESRDLIDLSMLRLQSEIPVDSIEKAESAYLVMGPLKQSITFFQNQPAYRNDCFSSLQIKNRSIIIDGLDLLASDLDLPCTKRRDNEYAQL